MSIKTSVEQNRAMRPGYGLAALVRGKRLVP